MPVKETWRERLPRARFKEETGDMRAIITCKSHPWTYTRLLYDLGQKDRNTDLVSIICSKACLRILTCDFFTDRFDDVCGGKLLRMTSRQHETTRLTLRGSTFFQFMKDRDVHVKYPLLDRVRMLDFAGEAGMPMEGSTTQQDEPREFLTQAEL
jgi:hypothetical protein